jgi:DNA-directed RNA polymerase subunit E"
MVKRQYVCRNCRRFTTERECRVCKSTDLSASWKGLAVIIKPQESEMAKVLKIESDGKYALFVG